MFRPQTGHDADMLEEAAALWESLGQNHPFVDGNKRTAFAAMYTFLGINGIRITILPCAPCSTCQVPNIRLFTHLSVRARLAARGQSRLRQSRYKREKLLRKAAH